MKKSNPVTHIEFSKMVRSKIKDFNNTVYSLTNEKI